MQQRTVGNCDLSVSAVGLGCNNFGGRIDAAHSARVIDQAIDSGITLFDTADVYGGRGASEEIIGASLGARRDKIVLATKFGGSMGDDPGMKGGGRKYVLRAAEESLRRLRTDRIDLYQMHFPDPEAPIEETLSALDELVRQGKVRYIGCSNFRSWQLADALWTSRLSGFAAFVSCQDEYNLLDRNLDKDGLPAMQYFGVGLLPYFPLASGMLSGKYVRGGQLPGGARISGSQGLQDRYFTDETWTKVEALSALAERLGKTLLDLAFAWLLSRPTVASVIAGATSPEQVRRNASACDWHLSAADLAEIDTICPPAS